MHPPSTNPVSVLLLAVCFHLALLPTTTLAVPGTRGKLSPNPNASDGSEGTTHQDSIVDTVEAMIEGDGTTANIHLSKQRGSRRNQVVESFFGCMATVDDACESNASLALKEEIHSSASDLYGFLVTTRRSLHQHPELMYNEKQTSAHVQSILQQMDIPFTTGWAVNTHSDVIPGPGGYGIVADIGTGGEPCVLLRADMDALPILERTEGIEEFRSMNPGKMHACGHDGHTTMLLGAASILKKMEDSINGTVRLMFQPAEEGGAGGKRMREEGILAQEPKPQHAFGLHVWPTYVSWSSLRWRQLPIGIACCVCDVLDPCLTLVLSL